jgi:multiple antibiotic resistance protein
MAIWTAFFLAFSALLPLINPLGSALVFLSLIGNEPPKVYHSLARRIAINNVIFLGAMQIVGSAILNFFGISLPIVQVAGGLVIAAMGWGVLNEPDSDAASDAKKEESGELLESKFASLKQKAFYPFTFPVTSGPGTLVTVLTLGAHLSNKKLSTNVLAHCGVFAAVVAISVLVYFCYAYAPKITTKISPNTVHGILRVVAFILLCIGVQIAWNGISELVKTLMNG